MSTSKKNPLGMPHAPNISTDNNRLLHCIINDVEPGKSDVGICICWYRMTVDVTFRKLIYENDKMSAIAGVAKRYAAITNDDYHAGLWGDNFLTDILWISAVLTPVQTKKAARAQCHVCRGRSFVLLVCSAPHSSYLSSPVANGICTFRSLSTGCFAL